MIRTQIYLPKSQIDLAKKISKKKAISVSEVIRQSLSQSLAAEEKQLKTQQRPKFKTIFEALEEIKKLGTKGPKDLALNHDHYLYGTPKKY